MKTDGLSNSTQTLYLVLGLTKPIKITYGLVIKAKRIIILKINYRKPLVCEKLEIRAETLLKVGTCIVDEQIEFFEKGPVAMKPMVLADIAERVEMQIHDFSSHNSKVYAHSAWHLGIKVLLF